MAASHTLSQSFAIPQISKLGVLTVYGYGIRVSMQAGHLQIEDGIGPERRKCRLPRVGHRLKRLICISEDGFVTLSALRWLSDVGASFVMLDRLGKVRVVTGPTSSSEARLRRAQALALGNGTAVQIARELIAAKLRGQETVVRDTLKNSSTADVIAGFQDRLTTAESIDAIRMIESHAAVEYWSAWRDVPILFPQKNAKRVPSHWLRFGTRRSPLTGGPRLSVNPANSLLNYTNAVAESECRLAASVCGLDPGIGFIHTDTANRDSLALDLIETIRPAIEAWLLDWLTREPLRRSDFFETPSGNCRISSDLSSKLSETAPTWGKLVAPWAEYVAHYELTDDYDGRKALAKNFFMLLDSYQNHPEAKSLGPDGKSCDSETRGLLQRAHIVANSPLVYIGKESDKHWEEGEDLSLLEFQAIQYRRTGNAVASEEELGRIAKVPKREFMRRGINQHTLEKICKQEPVRAMKLGKCLKVLEEYEASKGSRQVNA